MLAFRHCEANLRSPHGKTAAMSGAMSSSFQQATGNKLNGTLSPFPASQVCSSLSNSATMSVRRKRRTLVVTGCHGEEKNGEKRSFLSLEEAGLVEISGLSVHERFLCRLTISSLNLLRIISEEEGLPIEDLNAGRICDWFLKDKLKREQKLDSAVLQWDEPEPDFQI